MNDEDKKYNKLKSDFICYMYDEKEKLYESQAELHNPYINNTLNKDIQAAFISGKIFQLLEVEIFLEGVEKKIERKEKNE